MMPALYETMTVEISGDGVGLRFYGEHKKFAGFTSVYEESTDDVEASAETTLPQLAEGDRITVEDVESEQHFTQPPSRYTEASLVRALEEKGIGRPSPTRRPSPPSSPEDMSAAKSAGCIPRSWGAW
jgi:DNA topoisomerase-1